MDRSGPAIVAFLPSGSLSGNFVDRITRECFGLAATEVSCDRECSHGDDYRLLFLTVIDFSTKVDYYSMVERSGLDFACIKSTSAFHGWDQQVVTSHLAREAYDSARRVDVEFVCDTLKSGNEAESDILKYLPNISGKDAVVNIGEMKLSFSCQENEVDRNKLISEAVACTENCCGPSNALDVSKLASQRKGAAEDLHMAQVLGIDCGEFGEGLNDALRVMVEEELANEGFLDESMSLYSGLREDK